MLSRPIANSKMKDLDPCLAENEVVADRFLVVDLLGSGSFGQIYRVLDRRNNLFAAIKVEIRHLDLKRDKLPMELNVLKILRTANKTHFVQLIAAGILEEKNLNYIVMQLVGYSLSYYRKQSPPLTNGLYKFSSKSIVRFGVECVEAPEEFHDIQFIHRDIKPVVKFCDGLIGDAHKDTVYLLDFGLSRKYLDDEGKHKAARATAPFRGSIRYCSVDAWERKDLGRKDDIESLFYMLYESWAGTLPWAKLPKNSPTEANVSLRRSILVQPVAVPRGFERFGTLINELSFDSKPNYDQLKSILIDIGATHNLKPSDLWDWENGYQYVLEEYASGRTFDQGKITTAVETNSFKKSPNVVSPSSMNRQSTPPTSKVAGDEPAFDIPTNQNGAQQGPSMQS